MGRTHFHLVAQHLLSAGGVVSGMRRDAEVAFMIDARRARVVGGLKFWRSVNGVILTEGDGGEG